MINCKNCNKDFNRTSRSRVCTTCREAVKKAKKSIRNARYYKKRKGTDNPTDQLNKKLERVNKLKTELDKVFNSINGLKISQFS